LGQQPAGVLEGVAHRHRAVDAELNEPAARDAEDDARSVDGNAAGHLPEDDVPVPPVLAQIYRPARVEHELRFGNLEQRRVPPHEAPRRSLEIAECGLRPFRPGDASALDEGHASGTPVDVEMPTGPGLRLECRNGRDRFGRNLVDDPRQLHRSDGRDEPRGCHDLRGQRIRDRLADRVGVLRDECHHDGKHPRGGEL